MFTRARPAKASPNARTGGSTHFFPLFFFTVPMSSMPKHCAWYVLQKCGWLCGILAGGSCPNTMVDLTSFISLCASTPSPRVRNGHEAQCESSLARTQHAPVDVFQLRDLLTHALQPHTNRLQAPRPVSPPSQPSKSMPVQKVGRAGFGHPHTRTAAMLQPPGSGVCPALPRPNIHKTVS